MDFPNCSMDRADEYRAFILTHDNAVKTEKAAWIEARKAGKSVIPYSCSCPENEPDRETVVYFEFLDEDLNVYVDFFNRDTREWIESFKFYDDGLAWTAAVDNAYYGDPLGIIPKTEDGT